MLNFDLLRAATDEFLAAALAGDQWDGQWDESLARLAAATGSTGSILGCYYYPSHRAKSAAIKTAIASPGLADGLAEFLAGRTPPCSRMHRVRLDLRAGFRVDHDDYTDTELARDPFYQDFLRPYEAFWNATAQLGAGIGNGSVEVSLKRDARSGPYQPQERSMLNAVLPDLRAAVRVAQGMLDAEAAGMTSVLHGSANPVFELDPWGLVRRAHGFDPGEPDCPIRLVARRLVAADPVAHGLLDRAVARAILPPQGSAMVPLSGHDGRQHYLQIVPVVGRARDVFVSTVAVAILLSVPREPSRIDLHPAAVREAFDLTDREAAVAVLVAEGLSVGDIARHLRIQVGTVRNHLKSLFEKTGTHRQAQLAALLARLRTWG